MLAMRSRSSSDGSSLLFPCERRLGAGELASEAVYSLAKASHQTRSIWKKKKKQRKQLTLQRHRRLTVILPNTLRAVRLPQLLVLSSLDLLSVRLLRSLVALDVFLLSLDAPDGRLLDLVDLRFTVLGLTLALVGGGLLLLGGLLVGALEGAGILEGVGVLGGVGILGVGVVATGRVGVVVAAVVWVAVAASVAALVHVCGVGGVDRGVAQR
jgi:hypothetical protein